MMLCVEDNQRLSSGRGASQARDKAELKMTAKLQTTGEFKLSDDCMLIELYSYFKALNVIYPKLAFVILDYFIQIL